MYMRFVKSVVSRNHVTVMEKVIPWPDVPRVGEKVAVSFSVVDTVIEVRHFLYRQTISVVLEDSSTLSIDHAETCRRYLDLGFVPEGKADGIDHAERGAES